MFLKYFSVISLVLNSNYVLSAGDNSAYKPVSPMAISLINLVYNSHDVNQEFKNIKFYVSKHKPCNIPSQQSSGILLSSGLTATIVNNSSFNVSNNILNISIPSTVIFLLLKKLKICTLQQHESINYRYTDEESTLFALKKMYTNELRDLKNVFKDALQQMDHSPFISMKFFIKQELNKRNHPESKNYSYKGNIKKRSLNISMKRS